MSKTLKKVLKKLVAKDTKEALAVADAKLGNSIKVSCIECKITGYQNAYILRQ